MRTGLHDSVSLKAALVLGVPYGLFLSAIYLLAYWSPLGLKPFHYANVADLSSATLAGLAISFIWLLVGVIGGFMAGRLLPEPSGSSGKYIFILLMVLSVAAIVGFLVFVQNPLKWFAIGMFASFLLTPLFMAVPALGPLVANDYSRVALTILVVFLPAAMYGYGATSAAVVLSESEGVKINVARSDLSEDENTQLKYAGMLGNFHVAYEPKTRTTLLIPGNAKVSISPVKVAVSGCTPP